MLVRTIINGAIMTFYFFFLTNSFVGLVSSFLLCETLRVVEMIIPLGLKVGAKSIGSKSLLEDDSFVIWLKKFLDNYFSHGIIKLVCVIMGWLLF